MPAIFDIFPLLGDGLPKEKGPMVVLFNKPPKGHVEKDPEQVLVCQP